MIRYIRYFLYVLRHKYNVFLVGRKLNHSMFRLLIHDLSKFKPAEFISYAKTFYDKQGNSRYEPDIDFTYMWNNHQKSNKHHWQYWVVLDEKGKLEPLCIPTKYLEEMYIDWVAMSLNPGSKSTKDFYNSIKDTIVLHHYSKSSLEILIGRHQYIEQSLKERHEFHQC